MMTRYEHVAKELRKLISQGQWSPDERIPTEPKLCEQFHVSRTTIRQAVGILVSEGLLICRQGLGTYVLNPATVRRPIGLSDFSTQVLQGNLALNREILLYQTLPVNEELARDLKVLPGSRVQVVERLDRVDSEPISIDQCFIPAQYSDKLDQNDFADPLFLFRWIDKQGLEIGRTDQSIHAEPANSDDLKYLGISEAAWMLILNELYYDSQGLVVGKILTRYRGDTAKLTTSISKQHLDVKEKMAE